MKRRRVKRHKTRQDKMSAKKDYKTRRRDKRVTRWRYKSVTIQDYDIKGLQYKTTI